LAQAPVLATPATTATVARGVDLTDCDTGSDCSDDGADDDDDDEDDVVASNDSDDGATRALAASARAPSALVTAATPAAGAAMELPLPLLLRRPALRARTVAVLLLL